jgi:hypothetical protein
MSADIAQQRSKANPNPCVGLATVFTALSYVNQKQKKKEKEKAVSLHLLCGPVARSLLYRSFLCETASRPATVLAPGVQCGPAVQAAGRAEPHRPGARPRLDVF